MAFKFKKTLYLYAGVALIIAAVILYFGFFQSSALKSVPTVTSNSSNIQIYPIKYSISNNSYVSSDVNFTFTSFFSPWNQSSNTFSNTYNSLTLIPTITDQSNPFKLARPVYLQFSVSSTPLSLSQIQSQIISYITQVTQKTNYSLENITIGGFNGSEIKVANNSFTNATLYFAFTVTNSTLYSFTLLSLNYTLTNQAVSAFSEILKTVSIYPVNGN